MFKKQFLSRCRERHYADLLTLREGITPARIYPGPEPGVLLILPLSLMLPVCLLWRTQHSQLVLGCKCAAFTVVKFAPEEDGIGAWTYDTEHCGNPKLIP
jgi:hypothetical protein